MITTSTPFAFADRVVGDRSRVAAFLAANDLDADTVAPRLQLLSGSGAEGVCRSQRHGLALVGQALRQLGDRRRLPRAVDTDHDNGGRCPGQGEGAIGDDEL
jgi:hypothetical protein